jgi:hypothetical protein
MRRPQALLAAVLALAAPAARAAEPLDLDLRKLGPPSAAIWEAAGASSADAAVLAADARTRFARLSSSLALALSSSLLEPAATIGHSGFAFDLESSYTAVGNGVVGTTAFAAPAFPRNAWPTRTMTPSALLVPSFHVRKALPYSFELGGRILYLSQSSYFAAQIHGKVALQEGYAMIPDVALLAAHTIFLGQKDLDLSATDLTLLTSKRFGLGAVISLSPYLAFRYLLVRASSDPLAYAPDYAAPGDPSIPPALPATVLAQSAAFPALSRSLFRTTLGTRMTAYATTLAVELTYFGGSKSKGSGSYADHGLGSSLGGAFKAGFEF